MYSQTPLDTLSAAWIGAPYLANPLIGGPSVPEALVTREDAFDCVTYVEAVLARAFSPEAPETALRALRYLHGEVSWEARNHYTTDWVERNVAAGFLRRILIEAEVTETRTLSLLEGYPARSTEIRYIPMASLHLLDGHAQTGDFIAFLSSRADLDTFHVGMLVASPAGLRLRHASRSQGGVVEQSLWDFLAKNSTPGAIVARPLLRRSS